MAKEERGKHKENPREKIIAIIDNLAHIVEKMW